MVNNLNRHSFTIGASTFIGWEEFNGGKKELENGAILNNKPINFIYGISLNTIYELLLTDYISFVIKINPYYSINSEIRKIDTYFLGGIRFKFY